MITTVTKDDLVALGFSEGTSRQIIRKGKLVLIERGFPIYTINELVLFLRLS